MWFGLISLFPEMFTTLSEHGVSGRAIKNELAQIKIWNPRDFAQDKHRTVDDRPYGGGPGMLMKVEPLKAAIDAAKAYAEEKFERKTKVCYLSPQGRPFNQGLAAEWCEREAMIVIAGRYEGIDQRLIDSCVDEQVSLGDFVLSGGELAAMAMMDACIRLLPGALGNDASATTDSFAQGLLDYPQYTRPECIEGLSVPEVLLSGDHKAIERWRLKQALGVSWLQRPDLLEKRDLSGLEQKLLDEFKREYGEKIKEN